jgi:hypothetical protein
MDRDILDIWLEFQLTSLYGKVGAASLLPYLQVSEYSRRECLLKLAVSGDEAARKVIGALSVAQGTLDGLQAVRCKLVSC